MIGDILMANNHVYSIDLDISTPASSKEALKQLQAAFTNSNNSMRELNDTYAELAKHTKDTTELEKQYSKVVAKRLSDRDDEIEKLKAEKVTIAANRDLTIAQKKEAIALKDAEIERLENDKKYIKAKEKEAKLLAKMNKMFHSNLNENSKSFKLAKNMVAMQGKLNALLGKESKLRKAAGKAMQIGGKVAKVGLGVAGAAAGASVALGSAAVDSAEKTQEKASALRSLKSGVDERVLDEIYVKTGADYSTIVNAINRVASLVDNRDISKFAIAEIENPGLGRLLAQQTKIDTDFDYRNAINQIRKSTGVQDTSAITEAAANSRAVKNNQLSQFEHMQATAALMQAGIDGEAAERIITHIARNKGNRSFVDAFNSTDLSKLVWDQGLKNTLKNANVKLDDIDFTKEGLEETPQQKAARQTAEELRRFELEKNKMLAAILPGVLPFMKAMMQIAKTLMPYVLYILGHILNGMGVVTEWIEHSPLMENKGLGLSLQYASEQMKLTAEEMQEAMGNMLPSYEDNMDRIAHNKWKIQKLKEQNKALAGGQNAQGGIVTAPSLAGEAGPELILPLDYSRAGRASQIINNFAISQAFNMSANQQTPLAFASAVGQNKFVKRCAGI